jgi:hypothetical protein
LRCISELLVVALLECRVNCLPDDYYRHWPFEVSESEVAAEDYLKSLPPAEELAVFLSIRGMCLREAGRRQEAGRSFAAATKPAPGCRRYQEMAGQLQRMHAAI